MADKTIKRPPPTTQERQVLDYIGQFESGGDYNIIYSGYKKGLEKPLTQMTIKEVLELQEKMKSSGSSAVGAHQFINSTLKEEVDNQNIDENSLFTADLQDDLIITRLKRVRGLNKFLNGKLGTHEFAKNLSKEFASLPNPETGSSYYDKDGLNKSLTDTEDVLTTLDKIKYGDDYAPTAPAVSPDMEGYTPNPVTQFQPSLISQFSELNQPSATVQASGQATGQAEPLPQEEVNTDRNFLGYTGDINAFSSDFGLINKEFTDGGSIKWMNDWIKDPEAQAMLARKYAKGGNVGNCGGPGQPPCPDTEIKLEPEVVNENKNYQRFLFDSSNDPRKNLEMDNEFHSIHVKSNKGCTAGALNCNTDYVAPFVGQKPIRELLKDVDIRKYQVNTLQEDGNYAPNNSLDAWELHDAMVGEKLGTSMMNNIVDGELDSSKYEKGSRFPKGFDYKSIPLGAIIGQGDSRTRTEGKSADESGERNRHTMTVVGFAKDGMPMVYDIGKLVRLDKIKTLNTNSKVSRITIPNGYDKYTNEYITKSNQGYLDALGFNKAKDVNYKSEKKHIKAIEKGVNKYRERIGTDLGIPAKTLDKLASFLPGLANQESGINNNEEVTRTRYADNLLGNTVGKAIIKGVNNIGTSISNSNKEEGNWEQDYELEVKAFKKFKDKDSKEFKEYFKELKTNRDNNIKKPINTDYTSSSGPFKIKDISDYGKSIGLSKSKMYGITVSNSKELENGAAGALVHLAEDYKRLKKDNPELTEKQLIDLALVKYSNDGKSNDPEFIDNYIKSNNLEDIVLNKIKKFKSFKHGGLLSNTK